MQQRERSLLVVSAVSTLTALSLALYILWNSGSSDDQDQKRADISPEIVPDEPRKVKDKKHPLERKDIFYDSCVYMDYNATTPVYTEVYESMEPFFTIHFGNPSSSHLFGPDAKRAIDLARLQVAKMISCTSPSEEIVFTSCGTESDNSAIDIAIFQYLKRRQLTPRTCPIEQLPEIITTAIEHPAVLCYLRNLKLDGSIKLVILSVNSEGFVSLNELERVLTVNTALVSIMHSNNEVGTLQPIRAISHTISAFNRRNKTKVLFHSDAAQSVGKIPIDVNFLGVDMLTIVGHKYGAPKGIAVLYVKRSSVAHVPPLLVGGGQEKGRRAGTENVPYIVGLGTASSYASTHLLENILHLLTLKLQLLSLLQTTLQQEGYLHLVKFNGPKRSVHYQQLQEDMKVLRLLFHSHDQSQNNKSLSTPTANAEENSPLTPLSPQGDLSPASAQHYQQYQQFQQQQQSRTRLPENTAADVLEQLPNTISVSFRGLIGHEIVSELGNKIACSAGSACHTVPTLSTSAISQPSTGRIISNGDSALLIMHREDASSVFSGDEDNTHHSHYPSGNNPMSNQQQQKRPSRSSRGEVHYTVSEVLQAMQVSDDFGLGTVRLSLGRYSTVSDVHMAVKELLSVVHMMWKKKGIIVG